MTDDKLRAAAQRLLEVWPQREAREEARVALVAALVASATDEGPSGFDGQTYHLPKDLYHKALRRAYEDGLAARPAVPETLDVDIFRQAAIEAHVWSPDHESGDFPCRYEPCRKRYAALRSKEPT